MGLMNGVLHAQGFLFRFTHQKKKFQFNALSVSCFSIFSLYLILLLLHFFIIFIFCCCVIYLYNTLYIYQLRWQSGFKHWNMYSTHNTVKISNGWAREKNHSGEGCTYLLCVVLLPFRLIIDTIVNVFHEDSLFNLDLKNDEWRK